MGLLSSNNCNTAINILNFSIFLQITVYETFLHGVLQAVWEMYQRRIISKLRSFGSKNDISER